MTNFEKLYNEVIKKSLVDKFGYTNSHEIPKLTKIVLNMGVGDAVTDKKKLTNAAEEMGLIAGQKAVITKARKSIATFKVREEMPIGCKVTLRRERMYEFLERLVNMALPRIRDFHGIQGKNRLFSLKSTMKKLTPSAEWTLLSALLPKPTKKPRLSS